MEFFLLIYLTERVGRIAVIVSTLPRVKFFEFFKTSNHRDTLPAKLIPGKNSGKAEKFLFAFEIEQYYIAIKFLPLETPCSFTISSRYH